MAKKNTSDIINIRGLLSSYLSKWYLFAIAVVGCLAIAFLYLRIHMTEYAVRSNVLIQQEDTNPMAAAMGGLGDLFDASGNVDDEIFVISSHSLYRDVIRNLGLNKTHYVRLGFLKKELSYPNFPIDVKFDESIADTLSVMMNFKITVKENGLADVRIKAKRETLEDVEEITLPHTFDTPYGMFTVECTNFYPNGKEVTSTILVTGYHAAAEDFAERIGSEIGNKKTNVIELSYNTPNTMLGKDLLNGIIDQYNARGINEKNIQAKKTAEFIEQRLALIGKDLDLTEAEIQNFKENQGIIDVITEAKYQTEVRGEVESELLKAQTQLEIVKLTRDFVINPDNRYELVPTTIDSDALQAIIGNYNQQLIKRENMLLTVNPDNATMVQLTASIDAMRKNIVSSIEQYCNNMEVAVRDLQNKMRKNDSSIGSIPSQERTQIDLNRQRGVKSQIFLFLLQRQEENAMMIANATPKGIVVDEPYVLKDPLGMGKIAVLLIALILGMCIPPVYIYLLKMLRNRVETRDDVEARTAAPILGEMCIADTESALVVSPTDTSSPTELFRLMRANMLFIFNDANDKVALLTSSTAGEGKSFISINLAASLALLNKRVLLVGMDIRAPKLSSYLNVHNPVGLTQYLASSDVDLDSVIIRGQINEIPSLDVIVAGPIPPNPSELLASKKVDDLFAELRTRYDYIIVDSAPVGMVSDTFALNRISDATIYVTRVNYTSMQDIDFIDEIYEENRLKKLSIVVNGVKSKKVYGYRNKKGSSTY